MIRILLCAVASLTFAANESVGQVSLRTVALSGTQAPGLPTGVKYSDFIDSHTYSEGSTVFTAHLLGPGINTDNNNAMFADRNHDGISLIMRKDDQAPGFPEGVRYAMSGPPHVNSSGQIAFHARLYGIGVNLLNDDAIFSDIGGEALHLVARSRDQVDGLPEGIAFETIPRSANTLRLNSEGRIAINSTLAVDQPFRGSVLRTKNDGEFELLASSLDLIPGTQDEQYLIFRELQFSNGGNIAFLAVTSSPDSSSEVLISDRGNQGLQEIVRRGDQAPGLPTGVTMKGVEPGSVRLNDTGDIVFAASLRDDANPSNYDTAIIRSDDSGSSSLIARRQTQVQGLAAGVLYGTLQTRYGIQLNDSGQVAFVTSLLGDDVDNSNQFAIVRGTSTSDTTVIARTGNQAPGLPLGVTFAQFESDSLRINNTGTTLFHAFLGDGDSVGQGIFAANPQGEVFPVVSTFQMIDVDNDPQGSDLRQISMLYKSLTIGDAFSDLGAFSFQAKFTDGLGALFTGQITTPLPGDYNSDGVVDAADYTVWRDNHGSTTSLAADGDGDRTIGEGDYAVWSQHYGANGSGGVTPVPEPTAAALLAIGWLAASRRHGRDA
ncbi:hypothetical protein Pla108_16580 [Botrimarina colliarenosi]|uniref:PEP-CTERM protein-sorting domain-containing protein n=1 Tax=Botrimarina colliarenosi TaxID=2528001 RepID=A0A5C6ANM6_9BACT|nr:choice-of-anchor tandem repeat NxxGxxAF-containing protein [Botrimarina colliarenosi]TWU00706.1 hypothetical protein Pla108_16580 [Botrimarina colliarenosi]